jgi:tRNA pseudouridine55 synthase
MNTPPRTKVPRRPVHGVLLLDKPQGLSSNQALQRVKWLLRAEKAGHTGTLDPMATGALPLCFGAATKFSQIHLDADKSYEAMVCLGIATDSGDAMGQVLQRQASQVTQGDVDAVLPRFIGPLLQTPPMYSALKKDGKALYEYARDGIDIPREPRAIRIHSIQGHLHAFTPSPHDSTGQGTQLLGLQVDCSKGTYIRTLGEDIAKALGTAGHLIALRRTKTGPFDLSLAVTLTELEEANEADRAATIKPVDVLLSGHMTMTLEPSEAGRFLSGLRRRVQHPDAPTVAVYGSEPAALLGTAHIVAGELIPDRLLNPQEIAQILSTAHLPVPAPLFGS